MINTSQANTVEIPAESVSSDISPIEEPLREIKKLLASAQTTTKADDIRFRVKGWQDKSIVYVPGWTQGAELDDKEHMLAQRYYDPKVDCYVGLKACIARLDEEENKEINRDDELIKRLKGSIPQGFERGATYSTDLQNQGLFNTFVSDMQKEAERWEDKKKALQHLEQSLGGISIHKINQMLDSYQPKGQDLNPKRWQRILKFLEDAKTDETLWASINGFLQLTGAPLEEVFLRVIKNTIKLYQEFEEQWKDYINFLKRLEEEIALPVVAFNKFIGALNLHMHDKKKFEENCKDLATSFADSLATACLWLQLEQQKEFQKFSQFVAAETNFKKIATEIGKGVRGILKAGLKNDEVYPLLYIPNSSIDSQNQRDFTALWNNSYNQREEPAKETDPKSHKLWEMENKLGEIPIRPDGLGWRVTDEYPSGNKPSGHLFIDELYVDDPNSEGSISAYFHGIRTTGCFPLICEGRVYGLLYIHCSKRHFFTDIELQGLKTLGETAAITIKKARQVAPSYEELYGDVLLKRLSILLDKIEATNDSKFAYYKRIGKGLKEWKNRISGSRGTIANITIDTIRELCGKNYFDLPDGFAGYIDDYRRREGVLQSIQDYRDHFIHPFHVFLLGCIIMGEWKIRGISSLDLLGRKSDDLNLKAWFLASIYHDVGYPGEKLEALANHFFKDNVGSAVHSQFDWQPIITETEANISYKNELSSLFSKKMGTSESQNEKVSAFEHWFNNRLLVSHDHGVLTALMLFRQWRFSVKPQDSQRCNEADFPFSPPLRNRIKIDEEKKYFVVNGFVSTIEENELREKLPEGTALFDKFWTRELKDVVFEVSLAIALHSWKRKPENKNYDLGQLAMEDFPLAFFLRYCDYAQEWGRRVLLERMKHEDVPPNIDKLDTKLLDIQVGTKEGEVSKVTIWYYHTQDDEVVYKGKTLREFFTDIIKEFKDVWYSRDCKSMVYKVEGKDKYDSSLGDFGPPPKG